MEKKKSSYGRYIMAGSVFGIALATGFVMQNGPLISQVLIGSDGEDQIVGSAPETLESEVLAAAEPETVLPADPQAKPMQRLETTDLAATVPDASLDAAAEAVAEQNAFSAYGLACDVELEATVGSAAMVDLTLTAPCYGLSPVTISHAGLKFTEATNNEGVLQISVPAFAVEAAFDLRLDTGAEVSTTVQVPEFAEYSRTGLQWQGPAGLQIHAFEFGSTYDEAGHIWAEAAQTPARAQRGLGGFLTTLGNSAIPGGWAAEVYSFPQAGLGDSGVVRLHIEGEVTASTCGREFRAEVLQPSFDGSMEPAELTVSAQDCGAIGEFLVLKNILRDLKIASN